MIIGLAYDLKEEVALGSGQPDDALEEYDSRETVQGLAKVMESLGHSVVLLGGGRKFLANIQNATVDFVFNVAEGRGTYRSREAQVPAVLEMLDIPYSGSDPQCLAVCLDKPLTKKIVGLAGVKTPQWQTIASPEQLAAVNWDIFPFPAFVKPAFEGSSKGIRAGSRIDNKQQLREVTAGLLEHYGQPVMVEEFVAGHEITVGMVGNGPTSLVGIMRVVPRKATDDFVYSLEVKRDWENLVDYECPAQLDRKTMSLIERHSLAAFEALGCRDFGRADFRVTSDGVPYFLEINPLAGLNPHSSDLPIMARKVGWTYESLITAILNAAIGRYPQCAQK